MRLQVCPETDWEGSPVDTQTTIPVGSEKTISPLFILTRTGIPHCWQAEEIVASKPKAAGMPMASAAHQAYR
jgi:hypothetical protein